MMKFERVETARVTEGNHATEQNDPYLGHFIFQLTKDVQIHTHAEVDTRKGWESLSVELVRKDNQREHIPISLLKEVKLKFWTDEDIVCIYLPPKKDMIELRPHVVWLWRKIGDPIPCPEFMLPQLEYVGK